MKSYLLLFVCLALATVCAVEGLPCSDVIDCGNQECCVVQSPYKGRKKRGLSTQSLGLCTPLGTHGSSCYVGGPNLPPPSPLISYTFCDCTLGLTCRGLIYTDIPQGPVGTCQ